jgi:hypothetical protein
VKNPSWVREWTGEAAFDAIFLDSGETFLHIVGGFIVNYTATVCKDKVVTEKVKGGVSLGKVVAWQYDRGSRTLWAITEAGPGWFLVNEILMGIGTPVFNAKLKVRLPGTGVLPSELALAPSCEIVLPYYRSANSRVFVFRCNAQICIVQQLFEGVDASCAFSIDIYPDGFNKTVFVPGVGSDLPLCFLGEGEIVCVFVPNYFMCVIRLGGHAPLISTLPKQFSASVCGRCCSNSPVANHIVDLDSADIFHVTFDFSAYALLAPIMTKTAWDVAAQVCSSSLAVPHLSSLLRLIDLAGDPSTLIGFFKLLFEYLCPARGRHRRSETVRVHASVMAHLAEMDRHFPCADGSSRSSTLPRLLCEAADSRAPELSVQRAFQILHHQNQAALCLREAVENWAREFRPLDLEMLRVVITIHSEAVGRRLPAMPGLAEAVAPAIEEECSRPIARAIAAAKIAKQVAMDREEEEEAQWWADRLPPQNARRPMRSASSMTAPTMLLLQPFIVPTALERSFRARITV